MVFAIHAYETNYGGLHGIEDWGYDEAEDENDEELHDYGRQLSYDLVQSYGFLEDNEYFEEDEEYSEDEREEILHEHLAWDIIPLPGAPSVEACWEYLSETNDPEGLIEMYGE